MERNIGYVFWTVKATQEGRSKHQQPFSRTLELPIDQGLAEWFKVRLW
ncbi:MAG TPA: hypothetical protein VE890_18455 [Thermoguttaceae bacterium]|nr:hypothetical protein [Thermoguttaceae bacterium]